MKDPDHDRAYEDKRVHFIRSPGCGKWIDSRDLGGGVAACERGA